MMGTDQSLEWIQSCTYGARELMLDLDTTGAAVVCFLDHGALLPEPNVSLLQAPLADSAFTVPDLKPIASIKTNSPMRTEKQRPSSGSTVPESTDRKNNLGQAANLHLTEKLCLPQPELNQGANLFASMESNKIADSNSCEPAASTAASISKPSAPAGVAAGKVAPLTQADLPLGGVITLAALLQKLTDSIPSGKVQELPENDDPIKGSIAGKHSQVPSAIITNPEAFTSMYQALARKSSNLVADWISNSRGETVASDFTESLPIENVLLKNSSFQSGSLEKDVATLDALAGAALDAARDANATVEKRKTGEMREERFLTAMDRLADTLSNFENRNAGTSPTKPGQKLDSGEVLWLEEDELAGKLEKILKRQARRRGIDLS